MDIVIEKRQSYAKNNDISDFPMFYVVLGRFVFILLIRGGKGAAVSIKSIPEFNSFRAERFFSFSIFVGKRVDFYIFSYNLQIHLFIFIVFFFSFLPPSSYLGTVCGSGKAKEK